jgi:hypothetical protein
MKNSVWLERVPKKRAQLLTSVRKALKTAWSSDRQGSDGFPLRTDHVLFEIVTRLRGRRARRIRRLPKPKTPKTLKELFDADLARTIHTVHEYLYEESLTDAFNRLDSPVVHEAFDQINHAVKVALDVNRYGAQTLPRPRGNWIHRQLLQIARAAKLESLTNREMAEFFNYLCPCGARHTREAIKKFRQRHSGRDA